MAEPVAHSLVGIMAASPVGDYHTIEAPVLLQDLVEHDIIVAVVLVLIEIVGAHDSPGTTLLHSGLESGQVDLVQGTIADDDIHLMTVFLVVVQRIVLHAGSDAFRLQSLNIRHYHPRGQEGVFAHILEVAAIERGAEDVHARAQHHTLVAIEGFFAQALAVETGEVGVPGGSQTGEGREGHTRVVGLSGLLPFIPEHIGSHAMRTVVGPQVGESETLHAR